MKVRTFALGLFALSFCTTAFGQGGNAAQFKFDINAVGVYASQTEANLSHAGRTSYALGLQSLETQVTTAMQDVFKITSVVDKNLAHANGMTL